MKKVSKSMYVLICFVVGLSLLFGMYISMWIHNPEIMDDPNTGKIKMQANAFIFETKSSYDSHSEVCSAKEALESYADSYEQDMAARMEEHNAEMPNYAKETAKKENYRKYLQTWEVKFTPTEEEKTAYLEIYLNEYTQADEEKAEIYLKYEAGELTLSEALSLSGADAALDELYESDYNFFCEFMSGYNLLGWYKTPAGSGFEGFKECTPFETYPETAEETSTDEETNSTPETLPPVYTLAA